jgi:hypothetical protein
MQHVNGSQWVRFYLILPLKNSRSLDSGSNQFRVRPAPSLAAFIHLLQIVLEKYTSQQATTFNRQVLSHQTPHYSRLMFDIKMFSESQGDEYLPTTLPQASGTVFWSVTRTQDKLFVKVALSPPSKSAVY